MRTRTLSVCGAALLASVLCLPATGVANVDLLLLPTSQTATAGDVVYVDLIAVANSGDDESFVALDAILSWDPDYLQLLGVNDSGAGYDWFFSGFPPNGDLNQGLSAGAPANDGDALFSALAQLGTPALAPGVPGPGLVVTTLEFRALAETTLTTLSFLETCCDPAFDNHTRVLIDEPWPGTDITGDVSSQADVTIEPAEASLTLETTGGCQTGTGPGNIVTVELWVRDLTQNVTVFVAFVGYDTDKLLFRGDLSEYTPEPFSEHFVAIALAETAPGQLDLEGHASLSDPDGTDEDSRLAILRFEVLTDWACTATTVFFRPGEPSRVSYQGAPIPTELFDSSGFWVDYSPPEFADCPEDIALPNDPGECGAVVSWTPPMASDNCDGPMIPDGSHAPGEFFPVGVTTVNYTATDDCGNATSCSFDVAISDDEDPALTCPSDITQTADLGVCEAYVTVPGPTYTDNCPSATVANDYNGTSDASDIYPVGATTVTWTATDAAGNIAVCSHTVTVTDDEDPAIACPADVSESAEPGLCAANVTVSSPVYADNCPGATVANDYNGTSDASDTYPVGTTTVTWTVTDASGNTATCSHTVTVTDDEQPTITCPDDVEIDADADQCYATGVEPGSPITGDNCGVASVTNDAPALFDVGATTLTWTVTDTAGLTATCTQTVTVVDHQPPAIAGCPTSVTIHNDPGECSAVLSWTAPAATDNCGVESLETTHSPGFAFPVGTTTVTYTATDIHGNTAVCDFTVTVLDVEEPQIADCPEDITAYTKPGDPNTDVTWTTLVVTDNCDGEFAPTGSRSDGLPVTDPFPIGTTTVTFTATDAAGNPAEHCEFAVTVIGVPPLCLGDMNCDGVVDFDDIDPFVAALGCSGGDPDCWDPACPWLNGDCNDDGDVTFDDIDPFVARIGATCP